MSGPTAAVVGMGIAGLRAAQLLKQAGVRVLLFEARSRIGGRLCTVDEGNGACYEAGGEWIDADHFRVLSLMNELGHEPLPAGSWPRKVVYQGKVTNEADLWTDASEDEVRIDSMAREMAADLSDPGWENITRQEWDETPLDRFLAENTRSERGHWWVTAKTRSDEGDDLERIGLLGWLCGYRHYLNRDADVMSAFRFPAGASAFCDSVLKAVDEEVRFGQVLQKVTRTSGAVQLHFDDHIVEVDHLILAVPPKIMERIIFEPALSANKRCSLEACTMSSAIKIVWEFSEPWWQEGDTGGSMLCDSLIQQTWTSGLREGSSVHKGVMPAPLLSAYICGDQARAITKVGDPVRASLYELSRIEPAAAKTFVRGWVHDWVADPYCLGAFSHLAPGYVLQHQRHIAAPVERIHFAGEHTASWTGFIEGALESAERAATEVLNAE